MLRAMAASLHTLRTDCKPGDDESAHSAVERRDIVEDMAAKNPPRPEQKPDARGVRIPVDAHHWWPPAAAKAATERAKKLGIRAPGVRDLTRVLVEQGVDTDEDAVGRCLRGEIVTWEVAIPLSKILNIPPPARLPQTQEEAAALESGDEIRELLAKLRRLG